MPTHRPPFCRTLWVRVWFGRQAARRPDLFSPASG